MHQVVAGRVLGSTTVELWMLLGACPSFWPAHEGGGVPAWVALWW